MKSNTKSSSRAPKTTEGKAINRSKVNELSKRASSDVQPIFRLQTMIGNAAVRRLFQSKQSQAKGIQLREDFGAVHRAYDGYQQDENAQTEPSVTREWAQTQGEEEEEEGKAQLQPADEESLAPEIDTKLTLSTPSDVSEQEAEAVAEQVSAHYSSGTLSAIQKAVLAAVDVPTVLSLLNAPLSLLSRTTHGGAKRRWIFTVKSKSSGRTISSAIESRIMQSKGKGSSLPPMVQNIMSLQTGYDFSNVRVKTNSEAGELNRALNARAFTVGSDIWLGRNESINDVKLMAHELTHVVQQGAATRISPKPLAGLSNLKFASGVMGYLQALIRGGTHDTSQYRKQIAQFKQENPADAIDRLQSQILESPITPEIAQKSNSQIMRFCGGGTSTPASTGAVPTNLRQTAGNDAGGGVVHFEYAWGSSTGKLADLTDCEVGEKVDYPGFENPPFSPVANPTIIWLPGANGSMQDNHGNSLLRKPYKNATLTATQYYRYRISGGTPVNLMGPIAIVREVSLKADGKYKYRITKSGISAEIDPLP